MGGGTPTFSCPVWYEGNWMAINNVSSPYLSITPNWNYIIYKNNTDWWKLYKKSTNDTSNWTAITSVWWN